MSRRKVSQIYGWRLRAGDALGDGSETGGGLLTRGTGLVVLGILVDSPNVKQSRSCSYILRCKHRGHHGVILVVVFVHSIAADQVNAIAVFLQSLAYNFDVAH